jgi:hypothetical protein
MDSKGRAAGALFIRAMLMLALPLLGGCSGNPERPCRREPYSAPTLVGDLYDYCFSGVDRTGDTLSLCLHLDTVNLPSNNLDIQMLVLSSRRTTPIAGSDRLQFYFSDTLPDAIDPGILDQIGWKVVIPIAVVQYSKTSFTNCGFVPTVYIEGRVEGSNFLYDPIDTVGISIRHTGGTGQPPHQVRETPD